MIAGLPTRPPEDAADRLAPQLPAAVPDPVEALFPPEAACLRFEDALTRVLAGAVARVSAGPVTPMLDRATVRARLAEFDFAAPRPLEELLPWTVAQLEQGVTHVTHPRYFGLFNPAPSFPAQCADRIASAFNPQLASATTSPAAVEIESHVLDAVAHRAGLPAGTAGHFTSGGSEANGTALLCALVCAEPNFAAEGSRAFNGAPVFYISRDSHLAWLKLAVQTGVGRAAVRMVPTDGTGRLDVGVLEAMLSADRAAGHVPVMIAATAGTTNAGMVDPLAACAAIARSHGIWLHVDAAWGGAALASEKLRSLLAGIELAHSITIDAHKWFATTMGCGMFLTRHPTVLDQAFRVSAGYMPSNAAGQDPFMTTAQWSRRFLGLRLFLALAAAGWEGYGRHVERAVALVGLLARRMRSSGWSVANDPALAVLCLVPPEPGAQVQTVRSRLLAAGRAWISVASFEGREVIRACVTHGQTSPEDVLALADSLDAAARPP